MPHHAHSINRWDHATGSNLYEHLAGVNDLLLARAAFEAAVKRWPNAKLTLRNSARIIEKTWPALAYMVKDDVWEQAWCGRRKSWHGKIPGQEILCIGCLEKRLGRTIGGERRRLRRARVVPGRIGAHVAAPQHRDDRTYSRS